MRVLVDEPLAADDPLRMVGLAISCHIR
jgi:hypothetical protein